MKNCLKTITFLLLVSFIVCYAEIFTPDRIIDWSKAGYPGEIPYISSPVANVKDFGAKGDGQTDDYQAIVSAINFIKKSTPAVVYFPEGTYLIKSKINLQNCDGIIFRGEGYKKTKLIFNLNGANDNCIDILTYRRGNWVNAISGYTKGSTQIVVSDVSQFKVGDTAEIQQDNDPALMYTKSQWNVSWAANSVGQFFNIVGIQGNTLIIDPPLNFTFRADLNPRVRRNNLISNVGFEDFYIERVDNGDGNTFYFKNAANCWIRRIESYNTVKAHVSATSCFNLEIRDCYFHHSHRYDGGGHGYGVELGFHTTNCLVENNIFKHLRHSMMVHLGANGNVFGYNYSIEPFQNQGGSWTPCDISVHGHYPFYNLFEGNIVQEIDSTDYWGPAGPGNTFFRNRVESEGIQIMDYSHYQNVVGNEIIRDTISVESPIQGTLIHGNNIQGRVIWQVGLSTNLPHSLYKTSKPEFFDSLDWPPLGPEKTINTGTIPAKLRYDSGDFIPIDPSTSTQKFSLNIVINPDSSAGSVSLNPPGGLYDKDTSVTLTAQANSGWRFTGWSGSIVSTHNPVIININSNKTVIANFELLNSTPVFQQRIAVPAYFYPQQNSPLWAKLLQSAGPVGLVVANPSNGPGDVIDQNYADVINQAKSKGIKVVGYVYTLYGDRPISAVKSDIDKHFSWYSVDGIFVDETSNLSSKVSYYFEIYNYIKQTYGNNKLVVLNPGTNTVEEYMYICDIIINFEDEYSDYLNWTPDNWVTKYPKEKFWHLIINTTFEQLPNAVSLSKQKNAGWVYITPDNPPNPWDSLPDNEYWNKEIELVYGSTSSNIITYQLNLSVTPNNAGKILVSPHSQNNFYIAGTTVTLTAQATNSDYVFSHWSGDVGNSQNPVSILMDANKTVVAHFSVSVSTDSKPSIGSINLSTGQIVSGLYNLVISCSDDIGVSRVEVYIDGSLVATLTSSPYSYTIDTNNLSDGSHNLLVVVYDTSNQTQTTSINFTVDNYGSLDTLLKDNYLLTVNSDDKNEVIDFGDDIEWIKIYGINGKVIYESSGDVNPAFTSKPGLYIYKAKLKNGKIFTGKILVLR